MKIKRTAAIGALLALTAVVAGPGNILALGPASWPTGPVSFKVYDHEPGIVRSGDVATYKFSWNGIDAARATVTVFPDPDRPGGICARAGGEVIGAPALLYQAHDWIESCMIADTFKPNQYTIQIRETGDRYDLTLDFDYQNHTAHSDRRAWSSQKLRDFEFTQVYCPVSVALLIRSLPWKPGDERRFEVIDGNDRWLLVFAVTGEARIKVPAGEFDALKIEPSIFRLPTYLARENAGWWVKQQKKESERISLIRGFEFWMAKDPPRHFIKVWADVYFGHVDAELMEYSSGPAK